MNVLLEAFLNTFWQATAVTLVVWAALRHMPRVNAATRGMIWWSVLLLILLLPVLRTVWRRPNAAPAPIAREAMLVRPQPSRAIPASSPAPPIRMRAGNWPVFLGMLWFSICLGQIARLTVSYFHLRRLKRSAHPAGEGLRAALERWKQVYGVRRPARVLVTREIPAPVAVGFLRPAVLLPEVLVEQLTPTELDHVLLHELAHLARRDDWANLLTRIASGVVVLNPAAAFALRQIDRERELACDDWVVAATGSARPYAASLARLFELCVTRRRTLLASGITDGGSQLGNRIAELLRRGREFTPRVSSLRVAACTTVLFVVVIAASRTPAWMAFAQAPVTRVQANLLDKSRTPVNRPSNSLLAALVANGYGDMPIDDIIALKNHAVGPDFIAGMAQSGTGTLRAQLLIELHQNGVRPAYVHDILALGFGPYTVAQFVEFHRAGVPVELFRGLKEYGFVKADPNEIREAKNRGVGPSSLEEAHRFSATLTLRQIIRLKEAGVI